MGIFKVTFKKSNFEKVTFAQKKSTIEMGMPKVLLKVTFKVTFCTQKVTFYTQSYFKSYFVKVTFVVGQGQSNFQSNFWKVTLSK